MKKFEINFALEVIKAGDFMNSLVCETRSYQTESKAHSHDYNQLILPLEGELILKTSKDNVVDENHLMLLPTDCDHSYYSKDRNKFLVVDIPPVMKNILVGMDFSYEYRQYLDQKWKAVRYLLLEESRRNDASSMIELVKYACSFLEKEKMAPSIQYIHENYQSKISIQTLAEIENFNVSYFIEWFTKKTGETPNVYIQKVRLEKAKKLLEDTELSLLMISQLVGYEQQSSLTRLFKNYEKISPREYKKLIKMAKIN